MATPAELDGAVILRKFRRLAAVTSAALIALGLAGLQDPAQAQARPGPFPQWCPGDFWDPGWGANWNQNSCHADGSGGPQAMDPDFPGEATPQGADQSYPGELPSQGSYPGGVQGSGIGEPPPL